MAVGDVVTLNNALAGSGTQTIQPAGGAEWVIHNIVVSGSAKIQFYDGTNIVILETISGAGAVINQQLHVNNTTYLQIVDISASTNNTHYDGVVTK